MSAVRGTLIWAGMTMAVIVPLVLSLGSPLLAWRDPVYILAGAAGVIAMALLLVQPVLAAGLLPGLQGPRGRRIHRWTGAGLGLALAVHVGGLWITSPPDVIDVLLFRSPTPFSAWGVIALGAVLATTLLALLRRRFRLRPGTWRAVHLSLAVVIVSCSIVHALLIEGTMETISKAILCLLVFAATAKVISDRLIRPGTTRR